jgi:hypothetical protein
MELTSPLKDSRKENSLQDILDQATDNRAAIILLELLNLLSPEKDQGNHFDSKRDSESYLTSI